MARRSVFALLLLGGLGIGPGPRPACAQEEAAPAATAPDPFVSWTPWIADFVLPPYYLDDRLTAPRNGGHLRPSLDPRVVQVRVDTPGDRVFTSIAAADVTLTPERVESISAYAERMTQASLRRGWVKASRERVNAVPQTTAATGSGLRIAVPVQLPTAVKSLLGVGTPSINVSGSERISISGRSNWTNQENVYGRGQSLFPELDMRQDLQINVNGTLGDKMLIDIAQSSGAQTSLSNRVALRYNGYEDDVVRKLHLGNTQLSLPGTQYVSYSGRNDGLFGIMSEVRFGETDLALIASKQEARSERTSYTGTTQYRTVSVEDWNYIERKYFLMQYPDSLVDANGYLRSDAPRIDVGSVQVFVADNIDDNLEGEQPGYAELADPRPQSAPDTTRIFGQFDRKVPIQDFSVLPQYFGDAFPVLVLNTPVSRGATLAVAYTDTDGDVGTTQGDTLRLKLLKAPWDLYKTVNGFFVEDASVDPLAPSREYELRNFYSLGTGNLDPQSTQIQVRRYTGGGQQEAIEQYQDDSTGESFSYLEIAGLDLLDQTQGGTPLAGHDGIVDQYGTRIANWADWEEGILYFPDLRPFAPRYNRPGDVYFGRSRVAIDPLPTRRRTLSLDPSAPEDLQGNTDAYDLKSDVTRREARTFFVFAEFTAGSGTTQILLRNTPVLEGSEIVSVNGETLERDKDYRIEYQTGVVDLISEKARLAGAQLSIDYSYAPLFSQANRTLLGTNLNIINRQNYGLGGAFIYESRAQQEKRPRIGEEPSEAWIGDLNGRFDVTSGFLTSLTNVLPFYKGYEPSRIKFTGEMGHSIPNPNTTNELYIDDFEGVRISSSASMDSRAWVAAAPPEVQQGGAVVSVNTVEDPLELKWFTPFGTVHREDLQPTLTRGEDRDAPVTVLAWWPPQKWDGGTAPTVWMGVTHGFGEEGIDLSRSQYIDLWINDFRDFTYVRKPGVQIHIDVGVISEDAQHRPDRPPNGTLDTEDQLPRDRQLDASEDTGVDSVFSAAQYSGGPYETEIVNSTVRLNASPSDPAGDDFRPPDTTYPQEDDPRRWRFANGTERNQSFRGSPDTEDLDSDGILDLTNSFYRFSFDLTDTTFLDTDVYADYAGDPTLSEPVTPDNGWRRFLIPLDAVIREEFGSPDLFNVKALRVWLDGVDQLPPLNLDPSVTVKPFFEIAQVDIVGNRWVPTAVDSTAAAQGEKLVLRTVNNREDVTIYEPPFEVSTTRQGSSTVTEREQSLGLRATQIVADGQVDAYRSTTLPENYSLYESIRFYLAALDFSPQDSVRFFLRFSSDAGTSQFNYYEYSAPIPPPQPLGTKPVPWVSYEIKLDDLSGLKLDRSDDTSTVRVERPGPTGGTEVLLAHGTPSFTRVQRVVLGLRNARPFPAPPTEVGEIWIDELRAYNVDRDEGNAGRFQIATNFSDLMDVSVRADFQDQNFVRLGQFQGTGNNVLSTAVLGTLRLERLARGAGFQVPITFNTNSAKSTPRFITGQDIELTPEDSDRQRTTSWQRTLTGSISHGGSQSFLLRNTLDALSFSYSMTDQHGLSPTRADTSRALSGRGGYNLSPASWLRLPLPFLRDKAGNPRYFQFLPTSASLSYAMTTRRSIVYDRDRTGTGGLVSRYGWVYSKSALYTLGGAWQPLPFFNYSISTARNANLPGIEPTYVLGINFGRMTNLSQRFDVRIPVRFGVWISPDFDFSTSYTEARTPELSPNLTIGNFGNTTGGNVRYTLPFRRLGRSPADTTGGHAPLDWVRDLLGHVADIQTRGGYQRTTSYSGLTGSPSIPYRLGLDSDPGFASADNPDASVAAGPQASDNSYRTYDGEASTQVLLVGRASARLRWAYRDNLRTSNTQAYTQTNTNWPDLAFDWGTVQGLLQLERVFPTITANTRYNQTVTTDGVYQKPISVRTTTKNWQPVLSLSGTTKSGVQVALAGDYSSSLREDYSNAIFTGAPSQTQQANTTIRGSISRTYSPGSTLSFLGLFGSTLRSTVTLNLTTSYNRRTGGTIVPGVKNVGGRVDQSRFEIQGTGSYAMSRNITLSTGLGFNQFNDYTRTVTDSNGFPKGTLVQRSLRLELTAQMRF
jgi:hypothetical protein